MDDCYCLHSRLQESGVVAVAHAEKQPKDWVAGGTWTSFLAVLCEYRSWKKFQVGTESTFLALEGIHEARQVGQKTVFGAPICLV